MVGSKKPLACGITQRQIDTEDHSPDVRIWPKADELADAIRSSAVWYTSDVLPT
jgi:hypothetical protein